MRQEVTKDDRDIHTDLRDAVAAEVGRERFDLWFGEGVALHLANGSLYVSAADQFTLDRLRSQFRDDLVAACRRLHASPDEIAVQFRLDSALATPDRESDDARCVREPRPVAAARTAGERSSRVRRFARLDQFVVGSGNRVAFTAAQMVAERPGSLSPLFLFGPTGCGKTHLLEGIWSAVRSTARNRRVLYLSAEQFTSMFLEALQGSGLPSFRHKYRHVDCLLIDDVQFFLGKRATLVELQHTADTLLREGRQLVFAADRPPAELAKFGQELTARFSGGLVCGVESADFDTRLGILRNLAPRMESHFPDDVLSLLAARMDGDARKLAGALNQLQATCLAFHRPIDVAMAQTTLADVFRATSRVVQLGDIDRAVCDVFGLDANSLQSSGKARTVSQPRALAMWLARKYTRAAYSEIGDYFGRRTHSTVISAQKQVNRWVDRSESVRLAHGQCTIAEAIRRVESQLRAG
ncbi:MAG: chromosomal replication initiator protein DnaA [Planctomycetes bacterium]|nr:chromosomal replication initiator protein DnaA [Planctomycetota bacterium]